VQSRRCARPRIERAADEVIHDVASNVTPCAWAQQLVCSLKKREPNSSEGTGFELQARTIGSALQISRLAAWRDPMCIARRLRTIGGTPSISRRLTKPSSVHCGHARAVRRTGGRMRYSGHAPLDRRHAGNERARRSNDDILMRCRQLCGRLMKDQGAEGRRALRLQANLG
jgi:hypothetical protein